MHKLEQEAQPYFTRDCNVGSDDDAEDVNPQTINDEPQTPDH